MLHRLRAGVELDLDDLRRTDGGRHAPTRRGRLVAELTEAFAVARARAHEGDGAPLRFSLGAHIDHVRGAQVHTTVKLGGELSNNKGINKQGGGLTAPALTAKDMEDIKTAMSFQCDYLAVSFPKNATDMEMARQLANVAGEPWRHKPAMIAKIERYEAIPHLESILKASDGIMVARGDLAVEVGNAAVPALQKKMIRMAREMDKITITATQMMESMIQNPVPTRAEVSDVANAVLDGTDAVMLSAETAAGSYPVHTVEAMARVCLEAEKSHAVTLDREFRHAAEDHQAKNAFAMERAGAAVAATLTHFQSWPVIFTSKCGALRFTAP